jgi:hypothetical protein
MTPKRLLTALILSCLCLSWYVFAQVKIGPFVGLRIPIYDNVKQGYWYFKPNASQFQIDPDPAKTSDGIWSLKPIAPSQTYTFGKGFVTITPEGSSVTQVEFDSSYMMYRASTMDDNAPLIGSACGPNFGTGAMWIGTAGLFVCVPNQQQTGFTWAKTTLQTTPNPTGTVLPPILGDPCGTTGTWSTKAGMFLCSDPKQVQWALVPMQ